MTSLHTLTGTILSVINNAILIVGADNRIIFANHKAAAMFRTADAARLIGQSIFKIFMGDDQDILAPNLLHLARTVSEFEEEVMLRRFDDTRFIALISTSQFHIEGQISAILSIHNVSGIKGIEKTLKRTERVASVGRMLDDINHQIRNPISVIGGLANRLAKQAATDSRYCQAILDEAERLEGLLDSLNTFSKLPLPKVSPVPIATMVDEISTIITMSVQKSGLILTVRSAENILDKSVSIDLELTIKALAAIVENACDASQPGSEIVISIGPSGKSLPYQITIIDRGCGINPEDQPRVFAPFYTRKTRRHGMGLTLAQKIISEQGGAITLESKPGEGTTVKIFLVAERRREIRIRALTNNKGRAPAPETVRRPAA